MPAAYVKPYVKRNKTDGGRPGDLGGDARPTMRFVDEERRPAGGAGFAPYVFAATRQRTMLAIVARGLCGVRGGAAQGVKGLGELMGDWRARLPDPGAGAAAMLVVAGQ